MKSCVAVPSCQIAHAYVDVCQSPMRVSSLYRSRNVHCPVVIHSAWEIIAASAKVFPDSRVAFQSDRQLIGVSSSVI